MPRRLRIPALMAVALVAVGPMPSKSHAQRGREIRLTLEGGTDWINTGGPIHAQDLRGKVVLLDFWTFCCINCHHVLPDLAYLEEKYKDDLVVIGVHTPKFDAERDTDNLRKRWPSTGSSTR